VYHGNTYLIEFQSVAVPTNVVTVTPAKVVSTVTTLKPSSLGASSTPSSEPTLKAENSAAALINLSPVSSYLHFI
jgi:transcription initiation factor TFIID subunit 4